MKYKDVIVFTNTAFADQNSFENLEKQLKSLKDSPLKVRIVLGKNGEDFLKNCPSTSEFDISYSNKYNLFHSLIDVIEFIEYCCFLLPAESPIVPPQIWSQMEKEYEKLPQNERPHFLRPQKSLSLNYPYFFTRYGLAHIYAFKQEKKTWLAQDFLWKSIPLEERFWQYSTLVDRQN